MMEGSRVGFFSSGVMWALLKDDVKQPEDREEFRREVTNGRMSGVIAWRGEEEKYAGDSGKHTVYDK